MSFSSMEAVLLEVNANLNELIEQFLPDAIMIRRRLHQIPELKYKEKQTSALIVSTLNSYGYQVQEGVGRTGVVAVLDSGRPGYTVALRADIDALPIFEETGVSYQSKHPGIMHACGHDGHTATLLLVARVLQQIKPQLKGKVKLIFQPAEEGGKGSTAMIQDGVLESPHVDAIFGYHNWPGLPIHSIATRAGCILAGSGRFEITIPGKRAHFARPNDAVNPVTIGADWIQQIKKLTIPNTVLNLIGFNSGDWRQGTSEQAEIVGCFFYEDEQALNAIKQHLHSIVERAGSVVFHEFQFPTINSFRETERVIAAARTANVQNIYQLENCEMAGEDFGEYLKRVPGCYFLVGVGENASALHTSSFDFSDEILAGAAHVMLRLICSE